MRSEFSLTDGCIGKNVIILRADMISSGHIDNKGKGPTQGLDDTPLTAEAKYSINFSNRKVCLSLHLNGGNSFLFAKAIKIC